MRPCQTRAEIGGSPARPTLVLRACLAMGARHLRAGYIRVCVRGRCRPTSAHVWHARAAHDTTRQLPCPLAGVARRAPATKCSWCWTGTTAWSSRGTTLPQPSPLSGSTGCTTSFRPLARSLMQMMWPTWTASWSAGASGSGSSGNTQRCVGRRRCLRALCARAA